MLTVILHSNSPREVAFIRVALYHIFFLTAIEMIMEIPQTSFENSDIDIYSDRNQSDLEYADVIVLLSENPIFLNRLHGSIGVWYAFCLQGVKYRYWTKVARSRIFCSQGSSLVRFINLIT